MNKELQDNAWAVLPKEFREEMKYLYACKVKNEFDRGYKGALMNFGHHNLTSDTEPEEMLCVSRKKVTERYANLLKEYHPIPKGTFDSVSLGARLAMIEELFGNDFLSDKDDQKVSNPSNIGNVKTRKETQNLSLFKKEGIGKLREALATMQVVLEELENDN